MEMMRVPQGPHIRDSDIEEPNLLLMTAGFLWSQTRMRGGHMWLSVKLSILSLTNLLRRGGRFCSQLATHGYMQDSSVVQHRTVLSKLHYVSSLSFS